MTAADFLSKYEIDFSQSLDQKGLGSVYIAKDKETEEVFALKIVELHPLFDKGEVKERFDFASELKHQALLPYFACYRFPNDETIQHFVLMPYKEKGSLADNLEEIPFSEKLRLLEKILSGLVYLHGHNCSWQMLRSDHILLQNVNDEIEPQFINYGTKLKINTAFLTNFEYLAPEQLLEENDENFNGPAADIWAFAVLVFEVFSGQLPFGRKTVQNPNKKIMERISRLEIADLFDKIPEQYVKIIKKSLVLNPCERPSANEILNLIKEAEIVKPTNADKEISVLKTLEKMGDDYSTDENTSGSLAFFSRKIKRRASAPLSLWEPVLWISLAFLAGYLISKL